VPGVGYAFFPRCDGIAHVRKSAVRR
jgi:hypothetical protein